MNVSRPIELLAPAKTADIGIEAVLHGADAVYIGGPCFGARAAAANSVNDIARLVDFAHRYEARVYVTLNTLLYDDELKLAYRRTLSGGCRCAYRAGYGCLASRYTSYCPSCQYANR